MRMIIDEIGSIEHFYFHGILINCARKLGYPTKDEGICKGFTIRWIEAVLTHTQEIFYQKRARCVVSDSSPSIAVGELA